MTTIHADFNAMTEDRLIRLTTRGSSDDIKRFGVRVGDRVKLSDGELVVEALVAEDSYYGLVGIPAWETMVDLPDSR
jgi:formylmethanofuran dehydrogenase subunit D